MRKKVDEVHILSHPSFLDLWANTVGALIFIIFITFLVIGRVALTKGLKFNWWPLRINTQIFPNATVGRKYRVDLAATGGNEASLDLKGSRYGTYRWAIIKGTLPRGLKFDPSTGVIYGRPEEVSDKIVVFRLDDEPVIDKNGRIILDRKPVKKSFRIRVVPPPPPPPPPLELKTSVLPQAIAGKAYAVQLAASGGLSPYYWLCDGRLPHGFSCTPDGMLAGKPTKEGRYLFKASVKDTTGESVARELLLKVVPKGKVPYQKLRIVTDKLPPCRIDEEYYLKLAVEGGLAPHKWQIEPQDILSKIGLSLTESGEIVGKPARVGELQFTIHVSCSRYGISDQNKKQLTLIVRPKPSPYQPLQFLWEQKK